MPNNIFISCVLLFGVISITANGILQPQKKETLSKKVFNKDEWVGKIMKQFREECGILPPQKKEMLSKKVFNKDEWVGKSMDLFEKEYGQGRSIGSGFLIYLYTIEGSPYRVTVPNPNQLIGYIDKIEKKEKRIVPFLESEREIPEKYLEKEVYIKGTFRIRWKAHSGSHDPKYWFFESEGAVGHAHKVPKDCKYPGFRNDSKKVLLRMVWTKRKKSLLGTDEIGDFPGAIPLKDGAIDPRIYKIKKIIEVWETYQEPMGDDDDLFSLIDSLES